MKLPSVYANKLDKIIDNNNQFFRSNDGSNVDLRYIKSLFDGRGFGDRINVEIKTKEGTKLEKLVLCKDNYFVNINNKRIYFDDIIDYKIKK